MKQGFTHWQWLRGQSRHSAKTSQKLRKFQNSKADCGGKDTEA